MPTQRPERNSFLNQKVVSVSQLIRQFDSDPVVRDRFRRHYAIDDGEIVAYFSTLRLGKIVKPTILRVFGVEDDGKIHETIQSLKKGAVVLLEQDGDVAMRLYCGNPTTMGPGEPTASNPVVAEVLDTESTTLLELEASEEPSVAELVASGEALEPSCGAVPDVPLTTPGREADVIETGGQAPAQTIGGMGVNPSSWMPILLFATPPHRHPPVPEPASLSALALGFGGLIARQLKGRKGARR